MHPPSMATTLETQFDAFNKLFSSEIQRGFRGIAMVLLAFGQSEEADKVLAQNSDVRNRIERCRAYRLLWNEWWTTNYQLTNKKMTKALYFTDMEQMRLHGSGSVARKTWRVRCDRFRPNRLLSTGWWPTLRYRNHLLGRRGIWTFKKYSGAKIKSFTRANHWGTPQEGTSVECEVDAEKRHLHMKLHSAGHLIDMALTELAAFWNLKRVITSPMDLMLNTWTVVPEEQITLLPPSKPQSMPSSSKIITHV